MVTSISHYRFNNTVNDELNSLNGSATDITYVDGKINKAASFNGSSSTVTVADDSRLKVATDDFSISVWIYTTSNNTQEIMSKGTSLSTLPGYALLMTDASTLRFNLNDGTFLGANTTVSDLRNAWHHIVAVFDRSGNLTWYVDGASVGTSVISTNQGSVSNTDAFLIGQYNASNFFTGYMDDFRFFTGLLSAAEIAELYNAGYGTEHEFVNASSTIINYQTIQSNAWNTIFNVVNNRAYIRDPRGSSSRVFVHDSDPFQKAMEFSGLPYLVLEIPTVEYGEQSPDANYAMISWKFRLTVRTAKDGSAGSRTNTGRSDMFEITDDLHKVFQDLDVKQIWRNNHLYSVNLQHVSTDTIVVDQKTMFENVFEVNGSTRLRTNP